jgi:ATPase family protein associated with various cellular activities (AAA)
MAAKRALSKKSAVRKPVTKAPKKPAILIVGDWVVDEYWFLVRHHSEVSSHTGFVHYRISSKPDEVVRDLCGAGHMARILYQLRSKSRSEEAYDCDLIGLGSWNEGDTQLINHLVHARDPVNACTAASALFRLNLESCSSPPDITLLPLRPKGPTIRVVRLYHYERGGLEQINRVDWEPMKLRQQEEEMVDTAQLSALPPEVSSIIIHDLGKGVVNESMVEGLKQRYPGARWFVRSKVRDPKWLELIKDQLELLVIGPEIAALLNPWESSLFNNKVTLQALRTIEHLPGERVVLLSEQREVIVRLRQPGTCLTGKSGEEPTLLTQLGWSSALFAALVWEMHSNSFDFNGDGLNRALGWAEDLAGVQEAGIIKQERPSVVATGPSRISETVWNTEVQEWKQAMEGRGIIRKSPSDCCLEVWRGSTLLPGYITCIKRKQKIVNRIGRNLIAFRKGGFQSRSLSIMLQADPGAGKTFLAKALAKGFGLSFIRYDVTQMLHRDDLLELFDAVATKQANENAQILVFVDEINARLDSGHAFGSFLAPLEEGIFLRRGNMFSLKPCVWVFAGTKLADDELDSGEKLSDFKSRMTMIERIDYASLADPDPDDDEDDEWKDDSSARSRRAYELEMEARLEQVYLGAMMIRSQFSDVQEVRREVLEQFYKLEPEHAPARKIRQMAVSLRNVQYGRITRANCLEWRIRNWGTDPLGQELVTLVFS